MSKVSYRKINEFKIFGIKIFELKSDYVEFSNDSDADEDLFQIKIDTEKIRRTE